MTRKEYLLTQIQDFGRRIFGVFPAQYPREILWAHNILPVEIWDPPLPLETAKAHLQPYICSVVQAGLELLLSGKAAFLDGLLFPHTCDSIQNAASLINDHLNLNIPCYFFQHPREPYRESARKYYLAQLKTLDAALEAACGPFPPGELAKMVEQSRRVSDLLHQVYLLREKGRLELSNLEFYQTVRRGEYMWPDDFITELEAVLERPRQPGRYKPGVILSGVLPAPLGLLEFLDRHDVDVTGDDLLSCSRRLLPSPTFEINDPWAQMSQDYFGLPPCSTKNSSIEDRLRYLLELAEKGLARGVIFNVIKFCEPELFDLPNLRAGLRDRGVPSLVVETEVNQPLTGALQTRVEAFLEMIG